MTPNPHTGGLMPRYRERVTVVALAMAVHVFTPIVFLAGVMNVHEGWGRDPWSFVLGLIELLAAAGFVWLTADAIAVIRNLRVGSHK